MNLIQAIILGLVQGITEFLPISSSGHLVLFPKFFGLEYQGIVFDVVLHLGTLVAVIIYFRKKIFILLKSLLQKDWPVNNQLNSETLQNRSIFWAVILSIIPAGVIGLWFGDYIEANTRSVQVIAYSLIFWGIMLGVADYYSRKVKETKPLGKIKFRNGLLIGLAQAVALVPGTSRSGITMTAGLFSKFSKKDAAEFSFLMSIPVIALAGFLKVLGLYSNGFGPFGVELYLAGFLASAVSGFLAIWFLIKLIERWSFMPFVVYRVLLGMVILVLF